MKTSSMLALALALAGAGAYAQPTAQGTAPQGAEEPDAQRAAIKFHNVDAEVVATDADKMTFTFKVGGQGRRLR